MVRRSYRVVVADDAADMRLLLRVALEATGCFVVVGEAANGQEAIDLSAATQPDLTVLDLSMPVMDGLDALPFILEQAPNTTVVVLSGLDERDYAERARASGAAEFVAKVLLPDEIVRRLLEVLEPDGVERKPNLYRAFPAKPTSPSAARHFVRGLLVERGYEDLVDVAMLLTSELVSNAVIHADASARVQVDFGDRVRVSVTDRGRGALVLRDVDEFNIDGRGLHIVESLARSWGTTSDGSEKVVWFEL